ncbi:MAG: hypothetical protein WCF17_04025 [Terracidiphilus sp.]
MRRKIKIFPLDASDLGPQQLPSNNTWFLKGKPDDFCAAKSGVLRRRIPAGFWNGHERRGVLVLAIDVARRHSITYRH